jgi:nitroreductase
LRIAEVVAVEFEAVVKARRSIRKFKPIPVPDNCVPELLEAARLAPSGLNMQPWRFIVVKSREVREKIVKATPSTFAFNAPVLIVCCGDMQVFQTCRKRISELHGAGAYQGTSFQDFTADDFFSRTDTDESATRSYLALNVAIAIEHINLKAFDLGLGACWIGAFDREEVQKIVDIDKRYDIIALLAVGYSDQSPGQRPRLPVQDILLKVL